jgi:peroxiredoxin
MIRLYEAAATMNILRSLFISAFSSYLAFAFIYALAQMIHGLHPFFSWLGLALAAGAPLAFLAYLYLSGAARTTRHPVAVSTFCGLGVAMTMASNWRYESASGMVHLWAGLCLLAWFAYLKWYSRFTRRDSNSLVPGSRLPGFMLETLQGEQLSSDTFRGMNHVLVFYRGNWCPLCSAQVSELAARYRELKKADTEVVLISSQPPGNSRKLAQKHEAPMQFLHDPGNSAAEQLGIAHRFGTPMGLQALGYSNDTAMPTVVITDPEGTILFADETDNYRIRPEPDLFLKFVSQSTTEGI